MKLKTVEASVPSRAVHGGAVMVMVQPEQQIDAEYLSWLLQISLEDAEIQLQQGVRRNQLIALPNGKYQIAEKTK